ncbi:hypothetical protein [Candidatus Poriferisodalis sp.]|uniref:hypothetical protein n=1 Tax=Candidatus Poriferisodalis sp. TaxID=3101277 RepID=UPI003B027289
MTRRPKPAPELPPGEVARRLALRRPPPDDPTGTMKLSMPDSGHVSELVETITASGVLAYLQRRVKPKRGGGSRLPLLALLVSMLYCAGEGNSYWRLSLTKFIASLHPNDAVRLGVHTFENLEKPITYTIICKQAKRVETALRQGWTDHDGTRCDCQWFIDSMLRASVPAEVARRVLAIAIDSTDFPTWAARRLWRADDVPVTDEEIVKLNRVARPRKGAERRRFADP